jgi:hypothetical protein
MAQQTDVPAALDARLRRRLDAYLTLEEHSATATRPAPDAPTVSASPTALSAPPASTNDQGIPEVGADVPVFVLTAAGANSTASVGPPEHPNLVPGHRDFAGHANLAATQQNQHGVVLALRQPPFAESQPGGATHQTSLDGALSSASNVLRSIRTGLPDTRVYAELLSGRLVRFAVPGLTAAHPLQGALASLVASFAVTFGVVLLGLVFLGHALA